MAGEDVAWGVPLATQDMASAPPSPRVSGSSRSYSDGPDEQLLAWAAGGDRRAFDEIVVRHGPFALRVAARLVCDRSLAEDLVQEAFVRAWAQAGRFDPRRARFTTWLYRIITNLCIDQRRRIRPQALDGRLDPVDPAAGAQERVELDEQERALMQALEDLPVRQRAAVTLVYDEGLSGAEAASVLGISAKALERLLARARAHLRLKLQAAGAGKER
jgi:RNA polymerase sigma-70 factor (ECF subfamily)